MQLPLQFVRVLRDGDDDGQGWLYATLWRDLRSPERWLVCSSTWRTDPNETLLFEADQHGEWKSSFEVWGWRGTATLDHHEWMAEWARCDYPENATLFADLFADTPWKKSENPS
jgi:hypothetical protein